MFFLQVDIYTKDCSNFVFGLKRIKGVGLKKILLLLNIFKNFKILNNNLLLFQLKKIFFLLYLELIPLREENTTIVKKRHEIRHYKGVRYFLHLPANGQRTKTNASSQKLMALSPRKRNYRKWKEHTYLGRMFKKRKMDAKRKREQHKFKEKLEIIRGLMQIREERSFQDLKIKEEPNFKIKEESDSRFLKKQKLKQKKLQKKGLSSEEKRILKKRSHVK